MINQDRKEYLIRKNKGHHIIEDYSSGVSSALKRDLNKDEIINLERSETITNNDFFKEVTSYTSQESVFSDKDIASLNNNINFAGSKKCYVYLSHYSKYCGLLFLPTDEVINNLAELVKFDGDDVYVFDLVSKCGLHLEFIEKRSGNSFELRLYGEL